MNPSHSLCANAAAELEAKIAEYDSKIKSFEEFRENYLKEQKQSKVQAKRNKIENVIPKEYADSEEERNKAIASLEKLADAELDIVLEKLEPPSHYRSRLRWRWGVSKKNLPIYFLKSSPAFHYYDLRSQQA
jgi:hypothetical protein